MHHHFVNDGRLPALGHRSNLLFYDRTLYRQWILRAEFLLHREETTHGAKSCRDIRWLASRYHKLVESLVSLPSTFIHGEFYATNVLVRSSSHGKGPQICPVDWEMAAVGPGLIDLAALCSGNWSDDQKAALAEAYRGAWSGRHPLSTRRLITQLDCCYLHQSIQWLGWSLEWTPPADQTQNWLEIALRLAKRLKL
jgi:thiamine kinase-like enzyme